MVYLIRIWEKFIAVEKLPGKIKWISNRSVFVLYTDEHSQLCPLATVKYLILLHFCLTNLCFDNFCYSLVYVCTFSNSLIYVLFYHCPVSQFNFKCSSKVGWLLAILCHLCTKLCTVIWHFSNDKTRRYDPQCSVLTFIRNNVAWILLGS